MNITDLPMGSAPEALEFAHFPARWQAVVWRNFNLVAPERIALTLQTTLDNIEAAARQMGLKRNDADLPQWAERGYLTIIRRNWDLLPYEQLLVLLDWDADKLAFVLKEDDFMWVKMGQLKPVCAPVFYRELTAAEVEATSQLRDTVEKHFGVFPVASDYPFAFLQRYGEAGSRPRRRDDFGLKLIYSYSAVYGDPLWDESIDPYPENLLKDYAAAGVNAVWLQGTLYTLVPWLGEEQPFSAGWQRRVENLRKLVKRAAKHGIAIYLYMNEPRNMPEKFFLDRPEWRGIKDLTTDDYAMCTSHAPVLAALENGMERLFRLVPGLGGVFTITMSENLTHCLSRRGETECPVCAKRGHAEIVAEVNRVILSGVKKGNPQARVLAWSWAWQPPWDLDVVARLPKDITVMAVSETAKETDCLGIKGSVNDYSISKPGPGPIASRIWQSARQRGLKTIAKVQFNSTWELSSVPYIPVPGLVTQHLRNLREAGVTDLMLSWTLGGYPGGNLDLISCPPEQLAPEKFGEQAAPAVLNAWAAFDRAFAYFPLNGTAQLYNAPQNFGPMSLWWEHLTGRRATMIGFPYDALDNWRGNFYPEEIFEEAFRRLSEGWADGLDTLRGAGKGLTGEYLYNYRDLFNVAEAAYCHFRSTYLQICFVRRRNAGELYSLVPLIEEEIELAKRLYQVIRRDSRIGFEASNHYFYVENDLKEKILNCERLKKLYSQ